MEPFHEHHRELIAAASEYPDFDLRAVAALRKRWPAAAVHRAIELVKARRKAADKFEHADALLVDVAGVEQATSLDVARHKAQRFAEAGIGQVFDLCCGIGGDAMALTEVADVVLVDLDADRVQMAQHNVRVQTGRACEGVVTDVTTLDLAGRAFHLDPARRTTEGRRTHRYEDYQPGPAFIEHLVEQAGPGAVKLGPGVELEQLPPGEVELISRRGALVQAVLWTKDLARDVRSATLVPEGITLSGSPAPLPIAPVGRYVFTVDPAVERAGLIGNLAAELDVGVVHPALGLLTADRIVSSPFLRSFELLADMPWHEQRVAAWLKQHNIGIVEVKTRGRLVDPDKLARRLRGSGSELCTLFVLRFDRQARAMLTRRL